MGFVLNMDRFFDVFDSGGKTIKADPTGTELALCVNSVLPREWEQWSQRHSRRMYPYDAASGAAAAAKRRVRKRKTPEEEVSVMVQRVEVKEFVFEDGFPDSNAKKVLDQYARKKLELQDNEDAKATFDECIALGAFDKVMETEYVSLACVMCKEAGMLEMVLAVPDDFCANLQAWTKNHLKSSAKEKMPAV